VRGAECKSASDLVERVTRVGQPGLIAVKGYLRKSLVGTGVQRGQTRINECLSLLDEGGEEHGGWKESSGGMDVESGVARGF